MKTFRLTIRCEGAAFRDEDGDESLDAETSEIALILKEVRSKLLGVGALSGKLKDINGNTCGEWSLAERVLKDDRDTSNSHQMR